HTPPAIGMKQALREFAREFLDDDLLPFAQLDSPVMLASRSMLRKQAGPVLGVALDHRAPLLPDTAARPRAFRGSAGTGSPWARLSRTRPGAGRIASAGQRRSIRRISGRFPGRERRSRIGEERNRGWLAGTCSYRRACH